MELDVNIESREYNGKYYTDVKATAIAFPSSAPVEQPQPITPHTGMPNDETDLPF
jgi:hypothetical protein